MSSSNINEGHNWIIRGSPNNYNELHGKTTRPKYVPGNLNTLDKYWGSYPH
jgi:hypothetical protein